MTLRFKEYYEFTEFVIQETIKLMHKNGYSDIEIEEYLEKNVPNICSHFYHYLINYINNIDRNR